MSYKNQPKIEIIKETDAIFGTNFETEEIAVNNYENNEFVILTDSQTTAGETPTDITGETTITIEATDGETNTQLPFEIEDKDGEVTFVESDGATIELGKGNYYKVRITASALKNINASNIVLKTTADADCTIKGSIVLIQSNPRYSE